MVLASGDFGTYLLMIGVMIALIMFAFVGIMLLRKRLLEKESSQAAAAGLMEELRQMHKQGKISQAEYDAARLKMAGKMKGVQGSGQRPVSPKR